MKQHWFFILRNLGTPTEWMLETLFLIACAALTILALIIF